MSSSSSSSSTHTPSRSWPGPLVRSSPVTKANPYVIDDSLDEVEAFVDRHPPEPLETAKDFLESLHFSDDLLPQASGSPDSARDLSPLGFLTVANDVAKSIKDLYLPDGPLLVFKNTQNKKHSGITDTTCRPDITAAFERDWQEDSITSWPLIRLAGEQTSRRKTCDDHKNAASYLYYLLAARPDLHVAQGLSTSNSGVMFLLGISGVGIHKFSVKWNDGDLYRLLYAFIYRLYEPAHFADQSYIKADFDRETSGMTYTVRITLQDGTVDCPGFYPVHAGNPFTTRNHVLSNPSSEILVKGKALTVIKDQLYRFEDCYDELSILNTVHGLGKVPGVVEAVHDETITSPLGFCRRRICMSESGLPFTSIPTPRKLLETLFDLLEVLRFLHSERRVLHRDISRGNVLYIENSSSRTPLKSESVPAQETVVNRSLLCFSKYLLHESDNPQETSLLLVDFNLAEDLNSETDREQKRDDQAGTPIFIARAVEKGGPVLPFLPCYIPEVPKSPECYALTHPDRIKKFPDQCEEILVNPDKQIRIDYPREQIIRVNQPPDKWRRGLEHDAESVYWLLVYWAMVVRPKDLPNEYIEPADWCYLLKGRRCFPWTAELDTHSVYKPLQPLIGKLTNILIVDRHWLPTSNVRNDSEYVNEAFQRLILQFIIDNRDADFMEHPVGTTLRQPGWVPQPSDLLCMDLSILVCSHCCTHRVDVDICC